jgi:hypothetical protein
MELCLAKERVIVNEHRRGEGSTCKDREKHQASNSRRHFVYSLENNGVNFERHIEYSINECQVCGGGRNNGLETKHAQRRVSVTVAICLEPFFSSSIQANI